MGKEVPGVAVTTENLPSILEVAREGANLRLRVDLDTMHTGDHDPDPVVELLFAAPKGIDALAQTLGEAQGKTLEFQAFPRGARLVIDYAADCHEVECEGLEESRHPYSRQDLLAKSKRNVMLLALARRSYEAERDERFRLRSDLLRLAESETERARRRLEFFESKSAPRAERARGILQTYDRILAVLKKHEP